MGDRTKFCCLVALSLCCLLLGSAADHEKKKLPSAMVSNGLTKSGAADKKQYKPDYFLPPIPFLPEPTNGGVPPPSNPLLPPPILPANPVQPPPSVLPPPIPLLSPPPHLIINLPPFPVLPSPLIPRFPPASPSKGASP